MGGKGSKMPSEAEQRRMQQLSTIGQALNSSPQAVHFETLVFEGGGNKAVAYYGALKVMEDLGLLPHVKRFAGVGAGAGWATFLCVGLTPTEVAELNLDNELSYHAKFGMFAFMPNLAQKLGWSPLGRAQKTAQRVMELRTGKADATFKEIYDTYGRELCIVATNLTTGTLEYFHPKTTPDVPVVDALIMSATLPGIMKPRYLMRGNQKHYFVDGGVLCTYPIHSYDGWYLSMAKEHSFLSRLGSGASDPPFKGYNDKTLGFMLVTSGEGDFGEQTFLKRVQHQPVQRPNTKLARSKGTDSENRWKRALSHDQMLGAGQRLLDRLHAANISSSDLLTMQDFQRALGEATNMNTDHDIQLLFGQNREQLSQTFEELMTERDGRVTFDEFVEVAQQRGLAIRQHMEGGGTTRNIKSMPDIFRAVISAVEGNGKRAYLKDIDIMRSVGINTDYVSALDPLEYQDKNFLVAQGEAATIAYLLEYVQRFAPTDHLATHPIYSAFPDRQNSTRSSVIDPDEMRDYSVPQNLYPTLPPSYESAIGDTEHLNEPLDFDSYHPEKRPPGALVVGAGTNPTAPLGPVYPNLPISSVPDPWTLPSINTCSAAAGSSCVVGGSPKQQPARQPKRVVIQVPSDQQHSVTAVNPSSAPAVNVHASAPSSSRCVFIPGGSIDAEVCLQSSPAPVHRAQPQVNRQPQVILQHRVPAQHGAGAQQVVLQPAPPPFGSPVVQRRRPHPPPVQVVSQPLLTSPHMQRRVIVVPPDQHQQVSGRPGVHKRVVIVR